MVLYMQGVGYQTSHRLSSMFGCCPAHVRLCRVSFLTVTESRWLLSVLETLSRNLGRQGLPHVVRVVLQAVCGLPDYRCASDDGASRAAPV